MWNSEVLSHALAAVGKHLSNFRLPSDLLWKALGNHQERVLEHGQFWIVEKDTGVRALQYPPHFRVQDQSLLVSITDQGAVNLGVLDYAVYHLGLSILVAFDRQHRTYNDLKSSLKFAGLFRSFLSFTLLFNINYAPMGSKQWFERKAAALKNFLQEHTPHTQPFLGHMHHICSERMLAETGEPEQRQKLWDDMAMMRTCQVHGPLAKLMRWYSWWQGCQFYAGEIWMTRLIMLHTTGVQLDDTELDASFTMPEGLTPKEELAHLKKNHGGWALAPALVNKESMWDKQLIYELGKPLWSHYTEMSRTVKTCQDRGCKNCMQAVLPFKLCFSFLCALVGPWRMFRTILCKWHWVVGSMSCWS